MSNSKEKLLAVFEDRCKADLTFIRIYNTKEERESDRDWNNLRRKFNLQYGLHIHAKDNVIGFAFHNTRTNFTAEEVVKRLEEEYPNGKVSHNEKHDVYEIDLR